MAIDISPVHFTVDVREVKIPEIAIEASALNTVSEEDLLHGYHILHDVSISIDKANENSAKVWFCFY